VEKFVFYLNNTLRSSSTRVVAFSGLKSVVRYGQAYDLERFPKHEIFPREISRIFRHDDELKSEEITEDVIIQIEKALKAEKDIYIKALLSIAKETGLRLSEILILEEDCIMRDFLGEPILATFSFKNKKERAIPITKELSEIVFKLKEYTKQYRTNGRKELFLAPRRRGREIGLLKQDTIRKNLPGFIKRHNITDANGNLSLFNIHRFRHTLGTDMLNNGASPLEVKSFLDHKSLHSTSLYSKVRDEVLDKDYRKIGFVGIVAQELSKEGLGVPVTPEMVVSGALPDGTCMRAFEGKNSCGKFNRCLLCPKFLTTPDHLDVHKRHLARIREDRFKYMNGAYICNHEKVDRIEAALEIIIEQLEGMK